MKLISVLFVILLSAKTAHSSNEITFNFVNEEITKIVEGYSKASGKKFVIDPSVRGKISILNQKSVTLEEAFNQLSLAFAINGYAVSLREDIYTIESARTASKMSPVVSQLPDPKPERMLTWTRTLKHISASDFTRYMRTLSSRDGSLDTFEPGNQVFITDWSSNLVRISSVIDSIDRPVENAVKKIVDSERLSNKKKDSVPQPKTENSAVKTSTTPVQ
jgi:type II secretory pathway component GspD/PulD (secretin)